MIAAVGAAVALVFSSGTGECSKTFTVRMVQRAIVATYAGVKPVSASERRRLNRYLDCRRVSSTGRYLHRYWREAIVDWRLRRIPPIVPPLNGPVTASWFDDSGSTACGFHATYGFASLFLPCGSRVLMQGPGGTVTATMEDHGPYVAGRTFDLNATLKTAIGCSDLCAVRWRLR